MPKHKEPHISSKEQAQSIGYVAGFVAFIVAYFSSEIALQSHPSHWIISFSAAFIFGLSAYLVTLWRHKRRSHK